MTTTTPSWETWLLGADRASINNELESGRKCAFFIMYDSLQSYYEEIIRLAKLESGKLTEKEKRRLRPARKSYKPWTNEKDKDSEE